MRNSGKITHAGSGRANHRAAPGDDSALRVMPGPGKERTACSCSHTTKVSTRVYQPCIVHAKTVLLGIESFRRVGYASRVNAEPQLASVARALGACGLEAILIGNAAAALRGAPVTTIDFDFMIRETPQNVEKLKALAEDIGADYIDSSSPVTTLRRVENEREDIYLDFISQADGIKSFGSLRSRATAVEFSGHPLLVAALEDVLASKRAAGRAQDLAVLEVLEKTLEEGRRENGHA